MDTFMFSPCSNHLPLKTDRWVRIITVLLIGAIARNQRGAAATAVYMAVATDGFDVR